MQDLTPGPQRPRREARKLHDLPLNRGCFGTQPEHPGPMTTKCYDLYGTATLTLEELGVAAQDVLGLDLERHESSYLGGDYFLAGSLDGEHFVIQRNRADDDGEDGVAEPEFADYAVLLQVNATGRADELKSRLATIQGLTFLRRAVP
jgi:hypothetical protein